MEVLIRVLVRELDPHWLRFLLVLPADAVTLVCAFAGAAHLASRNRWSDAWRDRLTIASAGIVFFVYFLTIRSRLLESPVLFAFPYFFVGLTSAYCLRVFVARDRKLAATTAHTAIEQLVMPVPRDLLIWSMIGGGAVMIVFTLPHVVPVGLTALGRRPWFEPDRTWFTSLGTLQTVCMAAVIILATRYFTRRVGLRTRIVIPAVLLLAVFAIGVELLAENYVFKLTFSNARPPDRPYGSSEILRALGLKICDGWSRPSGVVVRQTMFFLAALQIFFVAGRPYLHALDRVLVLLVVGLTAVISALRINGTVDGLFDVGAAIGLGVVLFWMLVVGGTTLLARERSKNEHFNFFVAAQVVCLSYVIFLAFRENAMGFAWVLTAVFTTSSLYVLRESSKGIQTLFGPRA